MLASSTFITETPEERHYHKFIQINRTPRERERERERDDQLPSNTLLTGYSE
jgi:hypothetical protein